MPSAPPHSLSKRQPRRRNEAHAASRTARFSGAREPNTTRHNSDGGPCAKLDDSIQPATPVVVGQIHLSKAGQMAAFR